MPTNEREGSNITYFDFLLDRGELFEYAGESLLKAPEIDLRVSSWIASFQSFRTFQASLLAPS